MISQVMREQEVEVMEPQAIVELLGKTALFGSLADADRAAIAGRMRRVQFDADQMIFSRGDPGRDIYLVLEGRIRLSILSSDGRELSFAHAGPGSIFGEIATLDGGERTAGATAISRVQAMALPQRAMMELIENNPKVALRRHSLPVHAAARDRPAAGGDRAAPHRGQAGPAAAVGAEAAVAERRRARRCRSTSACRRASWRC